MNARFENICSNIRQVQERIEAAANSVGRPPDTVALVAVTKGHPKEAIEAAFDAGVTRIGENYLEEAVSKMQAIPQRDRIEWHMIGHVQSRKAQGVCENFDWVHSVDRLKLASRLDRFAGERERTLPVLLECNVSGEESKFGFPAWDIEKWEALLPEFAQIANLPHLDVRGLMTMAPYLPDPEDSRPYFRRLRRLNEYLQGESTPGNWEELSMGMSGDFEIAIQEGATIVRVGTAIFGERLI